MKWFPGLRAILTIGRQLRRIANALERLTEIEEARYLGRAPANATLPDPPEEPLQVAYSREVDHARAYAVEQRLTHQLGRVPSPEEICNEIDGIEWDAVEPTVAVGRRQPGLRAQDPQDPPSGTTPPAITQLH